MNHMARAVPLMLLALATATPLLEADVSAGFITDLTAARREARATGKLIFAYFRLPG